MEMRRKYVMGVVMGLLFLNPLKRGLNQIRIKGNVCKKRFGTSPEKRFKNYKKKCIKRSAINTVS